MKPGSFQPAELIPLPSDELRRRLEAGLPGTPEGWVEALRNEASRYYHTDAAAARRIAARALEVAELTREPLALGWGHRALAESFLFSGRIKEAEAAYAQAAQAWRQAGASGLLGQLLVGRIHVLALLGKMDEVGAATREARENLETAGDEPYLAKLAMNLGNLRVQREEYADALEEYERAAAIFGRLGVRDEAVVGLEVNRAVALTQLDRDEEALQLFRRLEKECGRRGFDLLQAQVRMNAAYVHMLRADFGLALLDLGRATTYFRQTDHPAFLASCHLNRAEIYHQLNLHRDSCELAGDAIPLFEQEGLGFDHALSISQEALALLAQDRPDAALPRIRLALSLFETEQHPSRVALMEMLWAEALHRRKRWAEAEQKARKALESFRKLQLIRWEATAMVLLDRIEARSVPPQDRIARLRDLSKRVPDRIYPLPALQVLEALGLAQEQAGLLNEAARTYRRAFACLEDVRARIPTEDSKIAFLSDKAHLSDRLIRMELERSSPSVRRLFEVMERSRAQSLWDRLRAPGAFLEEDAGDETAAAQRKRLSWLHVRISRLELGNPDERQRAQELRRELERAEREWTRLVRSRGEAGGVREGRRPPPQGASTGEPTEGGQGTLDPQRVARALPKGWGFLSYHLAPGAALVLAITREGATWRRLPDDAVKRVAGLADRLDFQWGAAALTAARGASERGTRANGRSYLEGPLRSSTDALLAELSKLLWKPVEELALGPHNWIVSPHGPVHRIPMHALRTRDGYLGEQIDLSLTPSARIWLGLPRPPARRRSAWVAGLPSPQLPGVELEVQRVARRLKGWKLIRELAPTREALRRGGAKAALVHLAAHGSLRRDNPAYSFVQLADGPLFVHDLAEFRLPGSAVVLTACSSGRGAAPAGDEWIGLARGFLQAGASSVTASLWPIQDQPTLELTDLFYERLAEGDPPPRALGQAMRGMMLRRPHPWHWASFAVLGGVGQVRGGPRSARSN